MTSFIKQPLIFLQIYRVAKRHRLTVARESGLWQRFLSYLIALLASIMRDKFHHHTLKGSPDIVSQVILVVCVLASAPPPPDVIIDDVFKTHILYTFFKILSQLEHFKIF